MLEFWQAGFAEVKVIRYFRNERTKNPSVEAVEVCAKKALQPRPAPKQSNQCDARRPLRSSGST